MFADVTVVVDGAIEQEVTFRDQSLLDEFVDGVREDAAGDGYLTEVFVLWHEHELGIECRCVQFVTDHKPTYSWNSGVRDGS